MTLMSALGWVSRTRAMSGSRIVGVGVREPPIRASRWRSAARLDEMLLITFGRAASQELRERVRDQLTRAERALADPEPWRDDAGLLGHLVRLDDAEGAHARLRDALAGFDAATIATTHQFCQLVLRSLGVAGDTDAGVTLVDDLGELVAERSTGRRNRIGTIVATAVAEDDDEESDDQQAADELGADAATRLASESAMRV